MDDVEDLRGDTWLGAARPAATLLAAFTAVTFAYTLAVAGMAAVIGTTSPGDVVLDPERAREWSGPDWFHGRPSAATGSASGGSNLGPTNPALAATVAKRVAAVRAENPRHEGPIPVDLVTAGGSGLDPHLSPAAARLQVARVAAASGLSERVVRDLVDRSIEPRTFGLFGQPRVNVIRLNATLRSLVAGRAAKAPVGPP